MPDHASRLIAALYDQHEDDPARRLADWGGDDLFTRMPRPRPVDDAPAPRFTPGRRFERDPQRRFARDTEISRASEVTAAPAPAERSRTLTLVPPPAPAPSEPATVTTHGRSLALVPDAPAGRRTAVVPVRPRPTGAVSQRRRPARTLAEWAGARPERIVAWAFALGLLLILIAISTADAAVA